MNEGGINLIRPYGADLPVASNALPFINVTGLQGFSNWGPGNFTQSTLGWRDVMTATIKSHTLKFGFEQYNIREADAQDGAFDRPTYNFDNLLDFVRTRRHRKQARLWTWLLILKPYNRRYRALYTGIFLQDDWKLRPRLTVNAGLRCDSMANFFSIYSPKLTKFTFGQGTSTILDYSYALLLGSKIHVRRHTVAAVVAILLDRRTLVGDCDVRQRGRENAFCTDHADSEARRCRTRPDVSVADVEIVATYKLADLNRTNLKSSFTASFLRHSLISPSTIVSATRCAHRNGSLFLCK